MTKVDSSMISQVEYSELEQKLTIEFTNGRVYEYNEVPVDVFTAFMSADSKGKFFNAIIKQDYVGRYVA